MAVAVAHHLVAPMRAVARCLAGVVGRLKAVLLACLFGVAMAARAGRLDRLRAAVEAVARLVRAVRSGFGFKGASCQFQRLR